MFSAALLRKIALLAAIVFALAACGNGDDGEEPAEDGGDDVGDVDDTDDGDDGEEVADVDRADGVLRLGYVLPETGPLAFLNPPMLAAIELAVDDINSAGGVLGNDVEWSGGDEADDAAVASETAERLLGEGVDAIIGAAASGMSLAIIDQVTGAGVVQCSGSNTSPRFSDYDDDGFYYRTAPTDEIQGPTLAEVIVDEGNERVSLMGRADDYGEGFVEVLSRELSAAGVEVVAELTYDPEAATFTAEVEEAIADDPEAIAVIGFEEGAQVLADLIEAGYGPQDANVYTADGMRSSSLWESVDPDDPSVIQGLRGTAPGAQPEFNERLVEDPDVSDPLFGGQFYDCVVAISLAAVAAGSDDPGVYVDELVGISKEGEPCSSFEECVNLLNDGEDIDYQGVSGPIEWNDVGDVTIATYEIWAINDQGEVIQEGAVEGRLE